MKKAILLGILASALVVSGSTLVVAHDMEHMDHKDKAQTEQAKDAKPDKKEVVNVGNKVCPVMGEKIDEKTKITYEYKGKVYNFCCASCVDEFKKDPEKYIQKIEEEKKKGNK